MTGTASVDEQPLVSVITPSFNSGPFIEATIRSVLEQDYPHVEHVVLDSGSTDQTPEVLGRYPSLRVVSPAPATIAEKINLAFELARGEIFMWINADDVLLPGAISRAVTVLQAHPDVGLVYSNYTDIDESGAVIARRRSRQCGFRDLVEVNDWVPHQTAFFRRDAAASAGGVDPRYPHALDWDLWIRISKRWPIRYVDDYWGAFRIREGQLSDRHRWERWREVRQMSRRHGGRFLSPLFFRFYWGKLSRAARLLASGHVRLFVEKLIGNTVARFRRR